MMPLQHLESAGVWVHVSAMTDSGRRLPRLDQGTTWPDASDEVLREFCDNQYVAEQAYCYIGGVFCLVTATDESPLPNGQPRR